MVTVERPRPVSLLPQSLYCHGQSLYCHSLSTATPSLSTVTPQFKVSLKSPGASGGQEPEDVHHDRGRDEAAGRQKLLLAAMLTAFEGWRRLGGLEYAHSCRAAILYFSIIVIRGARPCRDEVPWRHLAHRIRRPLR